jgi:hypothetical protein
VDIQLRTGGPQFVEEQHSDDARMLVIQSHSRAALTSGAIAVHR